MWLKADQSVRGLTAAWRHGPVRSPSAGRSGPARPLAHLESLKPHEARFALLVLEDEEGPPILIKRQRPHGRHGCSSAHPSTSRIPPRPPRRDVSTLARSQRRACAESRPETYFSAGAMWRLGWSVLEASEAAVAARCCIALPNSAGGRVRKGDILGWNTGPKRPAPG